MPSPDDDFALEQAHRTSGLRDETLIARYRDRRDLVAFLDETHRTLTNGKTYYAMSAVVFHSDDLPALRDRFHDIAGGTFWHSVEAYRNPEMRPKIVEMSKEINARSALPIAVFDITTDNIAKQRTERAVRDRVLAQALKALDREGITDVVLDSFPADQARNIAADSRLLTRLRANGAVSDAMWLHHARMGDEHALWSADVVAWSVQRHVFGQEMRDSRFISPFAGRFQHVDAVTGQPIQTPIPQPSRMRMPQGATVRALPFVTLDQRTQAARQASTLAAAAKDAAQHDILEGGIAKAPPIQGPKGPSQSL